MEYSLPKLLEYKKKLDSVISQFPFAHDSAVAQYFEFMHKLWNLDDIDVAKAAVINRRLEQIFQLDQDIKTDLQNMLAEAESQIDQKAQTLTINYAMNLGLNYRSFSTYPAHKVSELTDDTALIAHIKSVIQAHVDFRVPGLIIGGELIDVISDMVGYDPLYTCINNDHAENFKKTINNDFYYNSRLRKYNYDVFDMAMLDQLPAGQFGLIVCTGHIDMQPAFNIQTYFHKIKSLLRPGGTCVFTFFDIAIKESLLKLEGLAKSDYSRLLTRMDYDKTWWKNLDIHPNCQQLPFYLKAISQAGLKFASYSQFANQSAIVLTHYGEMQTIKALQASGEIINLPQ